MERPTREEIAVADMEDFEANRGHLWGIAYRILGTASDADDAVQEAWLRWRRADRAEVVDARAFLTTVVSRICYDLLGSARARREAYVGEWLPEPLVSHPSAELSPEDRVTLDESVGMALLTVLERLTPAERTAFVLHDVFAVPFPEIAEVVGRTPDAVRQLASRARRRVQEHAPKRSVNRDEHQKALDAFVSAALRGDFQDLMAVLDPDVVWRADGGGLVSTARRPVLGGDKVARLVLGILRGFDPETMSVQAREVNGAPGLVFLDPSGRSAGVLAFTVADGRITEVDAVLNPEKLSHLAP
ncbi:RNA polymerase sigma factor SigJ [Wenjunlia tyrosinilytica]|uniref:RNA polymerase sigma factor n=1 Tax=Wenjunlia tyrosinilytica TaxID=1544741 RepID=A0A917ZS12_9ACTN|nr:RNA polymerase sigma factor SigJ [Wenjunlia tyrosinilytica]GGO89614.1 RNA polymerase sigma factor [Wenjunlia tyrosinilytica]